MDADLHPPPAPSKAAGTDLGVNRWYRLDLGKNTDIPGLVQRFAADGNVAEATPDWRAMTRISSRLM